MEKNCKSCKKFFECKSFIPFPDQGCSEFVSAKKDLICYFAIKYVNLETGKIDILNLFDDLVKANIELKKLKGDICKRPSSHIKFYIRPLLANEAKFIADFLLISIVKTVAQDLCIAERGFKNGNFKLETFEKSRVWFDFAHTACLRGAAILEVLDGI